MAVMNQYETYYAIYILEPFMPIQNKIQEPSDFIWHPTPASAMANIGSTSSCRSSEGYVPLLGGVSDSRHQDIIRKPV